MSDSIFERESTFQFPSWRAVGRDACEQRQRDALTAELEEALREEKRDLSRPHVTLAQEFEHRVFNGLTAKTTETPATQTDARPKRGEESVRSRTLARQSRATPFAGTNRGINSR